MDQIYMGLHLCNKKNTKSHTPWKPLEWYCESNGESNKIKQMKQQSWTNAIAVCIWSYSTNAHCNSIVSECAHTHTNTRSWSWVRCAPSQENLNVNVYGCLFILFAVWLSLVGLLTFGSFRFHALIVAAYKIDNVPLVTTNHI